MDTQYKNWLDYINIYHYYPNPYFWGVLLFFLVPVVLWLIGITFIRRRYVSDKFFVFIAGSDNRLSLSRLQAFAWTLVIFGSFVAAMAIHKHIPPVSSAQAKVYEKAAKDATEQLPVLEDGLKKAKVDKETRDSELEKADGDLKEAQAGLQSLTKNNATDAEKEAAAKEVTTAQKEFDKRIDLSVRAQQEVEKAKAKVSEANQAIVEGSSFNWIEIPAALLLLAGIAIGSGVFSSLISALNDEEKTACVNAIQKIETKFFNELNPDSVIKKNFPNTVDTKSDNLLKIIGTDMGNSGKVRLGRGKTSSVYVPILFWNSNGNEIIVDIPPNGSYDTLVVDTPNGKLSYELKDLTTIELNNQKAPLDAELQQAKTDAQNLAKTKQEKEKNLAAVKANLQNLKDKNASAPEINEAQSVVNLAQQAVDDLTTPLDQANQKVVELESKIGKLRLGDANNLKLGNFTFYYEFSDLFRDDKNPMNMDLMKFQMFGWTVVAIIIYSWLFLNDLRNNIESLPLVPDSIVILTGLSQAGYLAGKGVSGVKPNKNSGTQN